MCSCSRTMHTSQIAASHEYVTVDSVTLQVSLQASVVSPSPASFAFPFQNPLVALLGMKAIEPGMIEWDGGRGGVGCEDCTDTRLRSWNYEQ